MGFDVGANDLILETWHGWKKLRWCGQVKIRNFLWHVNLSWRVLIGKVGKVVLKNKTHRLNVNVT